jgi:hypothetical protein
MFVVMGLLQIVAAAIAIRVWHRRLGATGRSQDQVASLPLSQTRSGRAADE